MLGRRGKTEAYMTFKVADIANEAQLVEIADRLSEALSGEGSEKPLDLSADYVDAAKTLLATLSERVAPLPSRTVALTEQQIDTFLDFDPEFLDICQEYAARVHRKDRRHSQSIGTLYSVECDALFYWQPKQVMISTLISQCGRTCAPPHSGALSFVEHRATRRS
jgi:hypothetical protein